MNEQQYFEQFVGDPSTIQESDLEAFYKRVFLANHPENYAPWMIERAKAYFIGKDKSELDAWLDTHRKQE